MAPKEMSYAENHIRSPPLPDDFPTFSSFSPSKGPDDNQSLATSSMEDKKKKSERLTKKIGFMAEVMAFLTILNFVIGTIATFLLWLPVSIFGMPLYTILLGSNSLSYMCFFFVYYQLLPPVIDERSIISHQTKEGRHYLPAYHLSKNELLRCYWRILLSILTNAGIWMYLSDMDFHPDGKDDAADTSRACDCYFLGMLLSLEFWYVVTHVDPLFYDSKIKNHEREVGNEARNNGVRFEMQDFSSTEDEHMRERNEEIVRLHHEISLRDDMYSKPLDKFIGVRKVEVQGNSRTEYPLTEKENFE